MNCYYEEDESLTFHDEFKVRLQLLEDFPDASEDNPVELLVDYKYTQKSKPPTKRKQLSLPIPADTTTTATTAAPKQQKA